MALGGTVGLDGADVDGPRTGGQGRQVVQPDRQGHPRIDPRRGVPTGRRNRGAAGVDHVTVATYEGRLDENLKRLSERLREGTYRPQSIRRHWIPKPGSQERRPLGIPTVQ